MKNVLLIIVLFLSIGLKAQIYQSIVCDSFTRQPLEYVIVSACSSEGEILCSSVTAAKGKFILKVPSEAFSIKVALLGYRTLKKELMKSVVLPDTLFLSPVTLKEVEVVANRETHDVDKDVYLVTDSMRKGTTFAADMLGQISGINYNWFDNTLSVYGQKNILLLVNGVEKSSNYIKDINPKRITKVEVIHNPAGRYVSDNYAAIINLILYEDYVGWDLLLGNKMTVNPSRFDKSDWVQNESPNANFTYTHNNITVTANYSYDYNTVSLFQDVWESYPNIIEYMTLATNNETPNIHRIGNGHFFSGGIDYQISKKHTLSLQGKYSYTSDNYDAATALWSQEPGLIPRKTMQFAQGENSSNDWVGTLFYRGMIGERWELYSDLNYNYYLNNSSASIVQEDWFSGKHETFGRKDYVRFNVDATYTFKNPATLKFGYSTVWKEYASDNRLTGLRESQSDNYRNRFFAYFSYKFNKSWSTSIGGAMEWIRYKNQAESAYYFALMPDIRLMYKPNKSTDAVIQYNTSINYPTLRQTSSISYKKDSLMFFTGNPYLKQAIYHNALLRVRLWNCLTVRSSINYAKNHIAGFYKRLNDGYVLDSYVNADLRKYSLGINYEKLFLKYLLFSVDASFERDEMRYDGIINSCNLLKCQSYLMYMDRKTGWRAMLQYNRGSDNNLQIQGITKGGDSYWFMALIKTFCKNRLMLMVSYFPPFRWLVDEDLNRVVNTDYYQYNSKMRVFNDRLKNTVMFKINYRLDYGKRIKKYDNKATTDSE